VFAGVRNEAKFADFKDESIIPIIVDLDDPSTFESALGTVTDYLQKTGKVSQSIMKGSLYMIRV
jgi:hypothetical protein